MSLLDRFPDLDPDLARTLVVVPPGDSPSVEESRAKVDAASAAVLPGPAVSVVVDEVWPGDVPVRRYAVDGPVDATLVYFHGGGWVTGDLEYSDAVCRSLAVTSRATIVSVDYRLAPEEPFPAAFEDAMSVVRRALAGAPRVVVMGDSAGANLAAAATAVMVGEERSTDGQVLVYPLLDDDLTRASYAAYEGIVLGVDKMTWFIDHYCPDVSLRAHPTFAPLKAADFSGLPPTVVVVAGHDPLRDEGVAYAAELEAAGVDVTLVEHHALVHGFLRQTGNSAAAAVAVEDVVARAAALLVP